MQLENRSDHARFPDTCPAITIACAQNLQRVGCYSWGLVAAKLRPWFRDTFYPDGSPYSRDEAAIIKSLTGSDGE